MKIKTEVNYCSNFMLVTPTLDVSVFLRVLEVRVPC
jgi:hypothetical protein